MEKNKITKGTVVWVKHLNEAGEVFETDRPDGRFLVKVARIIVGPISLRTETVEILVSPDDLGSLKETFGYIGKIYQTK